jgi:site-specific recombinase XerD
MTDSFGASIEGYRDWLPYSGKRKGASTIRQYTRSAEQLAAWAREQGRQGFGELTRADLRAFLNTLHGRGGGPPSPHWKSAVWYGIKSLFGYLADEEDCKDITQKITVSRPSGSGRVTHLDADQIDKLLAACSDPRELAVISVFLDAGVRIAEAAQLKVADVLVDDLRSRRLIVTGKGPKTRAVVIGSSTALALRKYLRWRAMSRYAGLEALWIGQRGAMGISGLDKLIRGVGANAGLEGIHPHLLRHSWAHMYRVNGGSVDNLATLAGWTGVAMSMRYGASAAAERAEAEARQLSLVDRMRVRS